jgi:hypothetical protein
VREDHAALDVSQRRGYVVGVDGRGERSQRARQALDLTAVEEARPLLRVREAPPVTVFGYGQAVRAKVGYAG